MGKRKINDYTTSNFGKSESVTLPTLKDLLDKLYAQGDGNKTDRDKLKNGFYVQTRNDVIELLFKDRFGFVFSRSFWHVEIDRSDKGFFTVCIVDTETDKEIEQNVLGPYAKDKDGTIFKTGVGKKSHIQLKISPLQDVMQCLLKIRKDMREICGV